jgi:hypothetical protein
LPGSKVHSFIVCKRLCSLELFLGLPLVFVRPLLPNLAAPIQKVFSAGQPIKLVEQVLKIYDLSYGRKVVGPIFIFRSLGNISSNNCSQISI